MARPPSDARDRALGAALVIASREGVSTLTIDAVARESGLSKGGVLHHFRTKDALVVAMVQNLVVHFEAATQAAADADPEPIGRYTRAFLATVTSPELAAIGRAMLAVVAVNPALLEPLRQLYRRCHLRLAADGIDPIDAHLCVLVADALWMGAIFEFPPPPPQVEKAMRERLHALTTKRSRAPRA